MFAKIKIYGTIEVVTGLHIGGNDDFSAIGAIDSPVIRDVLSGLPMIPGSSLKGKIRSLLVKKYHDGDRVPETASKDCKMIKRLFGSQEEASRLIFADTVMNNTDELKKYNVLSATEAKFENTINRLSGVANPRQMERVIRGAKFDLNIVYNMDKPEDAEEDLAILAEGLKFLQYDYLGGSGSRGYGKIKLTGLGAELVVGELDEAVVEKANALMKEAENVL